MFDFTNAVQELSHIIPSQGPISSFVHHNTLHSLQHLEFHQAVSKASDQYGARPYLPLRDYLRLFEEGKITDEAITFALKQNKNPNITNADTLRAQSATQAPDLLFFRHSLRSELFECFELDVDRLCNSKMIRLTSNFLDQGIAVRSFPENHLRFWTAIQTLSSDSLLPLVPFNRKASSNLLKMTPSNAAYEALKLLTQNEDFFHLYLEDLILSLPGWAGLVHQIERNKSQLKEQRDISLEEWLSLFLVIDVGYLGDVSRKPKNKALIQDFFNLFMQRREQNSTKHQKYLPILKLWQEAYEYSTYFELLRDLRANGSRQFEGTPSEPSVQGIFCLDDRSCSIRRHLEETDPKIETFGAAGFFGIDCLIKENHSPWLAKSCPVPVHPTHVLWEKYKEEKKSHKNFVTSKVYRIANSATLLKDWFSVHVLSFVSALRLLFSVFIPLSLERSRLSLYLRRSEILIEENESFSSSETDTSAADFAKTNLRFGYTLDEMADRVASLLQTIGLKTRFSNWVLVIGHGSSTTNNPYFAAYDCGACSGKPGVQNARAFCKMANDPRIRTALKSRGISIPDSTVFIAGLHDTSADEIFFYDYEKLELPRLLELKKITATVQTALSKNALERCRRFAQLPSNLTPHQAKKHVERRVVSLFEPRPEYNHATNVACLVGERSLSRNLFLDRRVFLQSYQPSIDPSGTTLLNILNAVIPVCGGINLEYYFSRLDPEVYGAGSKLPQNVVGLLGVMTGLESDLRTGLPTQMTEIHDPQRLLLIIQQNIEVIAQTLRINPNNYEWVNNGWIKLVGIDPESGAQFLFQNGEFAELSLKTKDSRADQINPRLLDIYRGKTSNLSEHLIHKGAQQ